MEQDRVKSILIEQFAYVLSLLVAPCGRNHLENTEKAEINDRLEEKITELYSEVKTDTKQINPQPDDEAELLENVKLEMSSRASVNTVAETTVVVTGPNARAVDR